MNADDQRLPHNHPPKENGETMSDELIQSAPGTQRVVRRVVKRRVRAQSEGFEGIEKLNRLCKSIAVVAILAVVGFGLFGRFYFTRFTYLPTVSALEQGDIAKQLQAGKGFTTKIARPATLDKTAGERVWHDVTYNPVYPAMLSAFFRVRGAADRAVALFNGLVHLLTGLLVYLVTVRLRGRRTAILAVVLYYVSIEAMSAALNGMGVTLAAFFIMLGVWAALKGREAQAAEESSPMAVYGWPALVGVIFGLAYLTGGMTVLLVLPAAALVAWGRPHARRTAALVAAAFLVTLLPWAARNMMVTGTVSPMLSQYKLLTWTQTHPGTSALQKPAEEIGSPVMAALSSPREMAVKWARGVTALYRAVPSFVNVYLFPVVLLFGLLGVAVRDARLVWGALLAMIALQVGTAALYDYNAEYLGAFMPLGLCLATVAAVVIITQYAQKAVWRGAAVVGLTAAVALPYGTSLLWGAEMPPAYTMSMMAQLKQYIASDALVATDVPAAVSWYTGKPAVLLPPRVEGLRALAESGVDPDYLYLSSRLASGPPTEWLRVLALRITEDEAKLLGMPIMDPAGAGEMVFQRHERLAEGFELKKHSGDDAEPDGATFPGDQPPTTAD